MPIIVSQHNVLDFPYRFRIMNINEEFIPSTINIYALIVRKLIKIK